MSNPTAAEFYADLASIERASHVAERAKLRDVIARQRNELALLYKQKEKLAKKLKKAEGK